MSRPDGPPVLAAKAHDPVAAKLSTLDRFLPVWIGLAMVAGLLLGRLVPGVNTALESVQVDGISLPIAIGLLVMMYPVLAKVRYDRLESVTGDKRLLVSSLLLNWVLGPALMFALLGWFYLSALPGWLGLQQASIQASTWDIARSVLIFLGVSLLAGFASRRIGEQAKGREWYESTFLPRIGPWALYGLLFTIVVLFALQGDAITSRPWDVARIALPLLAYFAIMWGGGFALGSAIGLGYGRTTTCVHGRRQQLRAGHRGGHRDLRRHVRPGTCRGRRPLDRGAGARGTGLRQPRPTPAVHPDRPLTLTAH